MADIQTLRTAQGDEQVVLSRQDYDALVALAGDAVEEDEDIAVHDARKAEMAVTGEAPVPEAICAGLLRGESLIRAIRMWRGLSEEGLARRAGIDLGHLLDLEHRRRPTAAHTAERLAVSLDMPATWLTPAER